MIRNRAAARREVLPPLVVPETLDHMTTILVIEDEPGIAQLVDDYLKAAGFTVLLTGDQSLEHQQNLATRKIGIVVLGAASNALEDLLPLLPDVLRALELLEPGQVIRVHT